MSKDDIRQQADKARLVRKTFVNKLAYSEITFKQFCLAAKSNEYKTLRTMKIIDIMDKFPRWTRESIQHAFVAYNLPFNLTVIKCMKNENYFRLVSSLMDSSSSLWQTRVKAPRNYPWGGRILDLLIALEDTELPREMQDIKARFYPDKSREDLIEHNEDKVNISDELNILLGEEHEDDDMVENNNNNSLESLLDDEEDDEDIESLLGSDDEDDMLDFL